uniref:Uncharacterized protein n=1 Tax=Anguilla anguilla TaxID=7936 RepID=A0A0E9UWF7_ANGAN
MENSSMKSTSATPKPRLVLLDQKYLIYLFIYTCCL